MSDIKFSLTETVFDCTRNYNQENDYIDGEVQVWLNPEYPNAKMPTKANPSDSGFDVYAAEGGVVPANGRLLVKTGVHMDICAGFECQVRPRSGLALKKGITVLNTPGTIDNSYTNECMVILFNTTNEDFAFSAGDRIAQFVFQLIPIVKLVQIDERPVKTERGDGGFGSTGK